jgi:hypothetical protein
MADTPPSNPPSPALLDNPLAPDVFADFVTGVALMGDCLRLTLASNRSDYTTSPPTVRAVVIGRLVMPIAGAENLIEFVGSYLQQLKSGGAAPPPAASPQRLN